VRNNRFIDNEWGAILGVNAGNEIVAMEPIVFEGNLLQGNRNAIRSYATINGGQDTPRDIVVPVHGNAIVDTVCTDVLVSAPANANLTLTVDARSNWWGSPEGPQDSSEGCLAIDGDALVDPWLTAPPGA
jgi:hypothetical protein